eukprot:81772_1
MAEPNYYIEHNRKVPYSMSPIQINDTTTVLATVAMSPNEIEWSNWLSRNPNHKNSKMLKTNTPAIIRTWNDYAFHMTMEEGRISNHFARLVIFENEKICCATKCIHNDFMSIEDCIRNLFLALRGSIMMFKKFEYAQLCYDCLMYLCSDRQQMERLFHEYHAVLTRWDIKSDHIGCKVPFGKELHYISEILFKYQSFTMHVLHQDRLCDKIFSLFIYYMKNFKRLHHDIKDESFSHHPTDQGFTLQRNDIAIEWYFEYTLNGILSIMRRLMCYLETKHLHKLIQMNYFEHFIAFTDDLFDLEYMRIIMDSMKPDSEVIFGGTLTLFQLLSVVQYINFRVMNKLSLRDSTNIKLRNKIFKTKQKIKAFNHAVNMLNNPKYVALNLWRIFRDFDARYLRDEYKCYFMMIGMESIPYHWPIRVIVKTKWNQRRKLKRCGNRSCPLDNIVSDGKTFKFCGQCKIVFYCSKHCQKMHWLYHRVRCKLFQ